jgi:CheY-like chemotaxis protein
MILQRFISCNHELSGRFIGSGLARTPAPGVAGGAARSGAGAGPWWEPAASLNLDVYLVGMSGLELSTRLRATGEDLPVLLIIAHDDQQTRDLAVKLRCTAYLRKPLDPSKLLEEVARAIQHGGPAS